MTDVEWQVYNRWHELVQEVVNIPMAGQIYLKADPSVCMDRVKMRGRQSEDKISCEYLVQLHKQHERWLGDSQIPTLVVDANLNYVSSAGDSKDLCQMVDAFIKCLGDK
jgi:deoxyadenosine/deoxycytidine kinase